MKLRAQRLRSRGIVAALGMVCLLALLATTYAPFTAHPRAHAATCATTVDIGYTVYYPPPDNTVRGSGSYTSAECLKIAKVSVAIFYYDPTTCCFREYDGSRVTRYPTTPSSAAFSAVDITCQFEAYEQYYTRIDWSYKGGGGGYKISNTINVPCS